MNGKYYVWDPMVRIFHWTLVLAFTLSYFTGDEENALHVYSGYYILALVVFRIAWGFIGTRYARFSSFTFSPSAVMDYLAGLFTTEEGKKYKGHNPAGSWMIIFMLVSLLATGFSGLKVYGLEGHGPLAQDAKTQKMISRQNDDAFMKVSRYEDEHEEREHERHGDDDEEDFWEEIHEFMANLTVLLVLLHISGVILSERRHGENLVRAMFTGYKGK